MSSRIFKCKCELSDSLPECVNGCVGNEATSSLGVTEDISSNVVASAACDGHILRLQFEIKLDAATIRSDEIAYLRTVLQFSIQLEKIIKDSGLKDYLKQK